MNEMIERVARAAYESLMTDEGSDAWVDKRPVDMSNVIVDGNINLLKLVRAAIAAMREHTEAMGRSGASALSIALDNGGSYELSEKQAAEVFAAMIDAALAE